MPWWAWIALSGYVVGGGWGFVSSARRSARNRPLFPVFDPFMAGVFGALCWPCIVLLAVALMEQGESAGASRAERRAAEARRVAEHRLAEARALREQERLLGIGDRDEF
jgi:hypothetical protein